MRNILRMDTKLIRVKSKNVPMKRDSINACIDGNIRDF